MIGNLFEILSSFGAQASNHRLIMLNNMFGNNGMLKSTAFRLINGSWIKKMLENYFE